MLFETPGLNLSTSIPIASTSSSSQPAKKRKRTSTTTTSSGENDSTQEGGGGNSVEMNLGKLMKKMKEMEKDSGWGGIMGAGGKSGVEQAEKEGRKKDGKKKVKDVSVSVGGNGNGKKVEGGTKVSTSNGKSSTTTIGVVVKPKPNRFEPAKKEKKSKKDKNVFSPATGSSNSISSSLNSHSYVHEPSPELNISNKLNRKYQAPNSEGLEMDSTTSVPQTSMQLALRAKLAGGKFRLLNESLYTSTGEEAWSTMKEEGAFDDYHAGFRSQAAHWPTHPLTILTTSLLKLPPSTLVVDFGCGDATLARNLLENNLKVISFDLVSKNGWVIEAECSSVPLPGGKTGGEIVDVVVCCLSLMGTDWIEMIREARRILVDGGALRIAEVTSRFNDLDAFIALITTMGFDLTHKDTKNTHFVMFDFEKSGNDVEEKRMENTKKAGTLLKPCIYKKR